MLRSSFVLVGFGAISLALGLVACTKGNEDVADDSAAVTAQECAQADQVIANIDGVTVTKKNYVGSAKSQDQSDPFSSGEDNNTAGEGTPHEELRCTTNVSYLVVSGTGNDEAVNKLLRGEWEEPTEANCSYAEDYSADAILVGIDPSQGLMFVTEPESQYGAGAAHPNYGIEFKVIDLLSGKRLSLGDYIKEGSAPQLEALVDAKIASQKQRVEQGPQTDRGGHGRKPKFEFLDADSQEMFKGFAKSYFTDWSSNTEAPANLSKIYDFGIAGTGLRVDMANNLPHAMGGIGASYKLTWSDLQGAGVLRDDLAGKKLIERTKLARPKQPHASGLHTGR